MTEIEKLIEKYTAYEGEPNGDVVTASSVIATLRESLPAERQAIEEAYRRGTEQGWCESATDYFNKTYKK